MDLNLRDRVAIVTGGGSCAIQDVADLVFFLTSGRAGFTNRQTVLLSGGSVPT